MTDATAQSTDLRQVRLYYCSLYELSGVVNSNAGSTQRDCKPLDAVERCGSSHSAPAFPHRFVPQAQVRHVPIATELADRVREHWRIRVAFTSCITSSTVPWSAS